MNKLFFVGYADNSVAFYVNRQKKESHQARAVQFEASEDVTLGQLTTWLYSDGLDVSRIHSTHWA